VLDPEVVTRLFAQDRRDPLIDELSERDREVLAQMAAGVTYRGIARRMFLSERAIERHVTSIFDTLGITTARRQPPRSRRARLSPDRRAGLTDAQRRPRWVSRHRRRNLPRHGDVTPHCSRTWVRPRNR